VTILRVVLSQNFIFCGADFGSTIALNLQQKLKAFPTFFSTNKKWQCGLFLEFIALLCSSEILFVKFP